MCIRDRAQRCQLPLATVVPLVSNPEYEALAPQIAAKAELCLLYTSDAADERSSVDLGGRRIIKKKNKLNNLNGRAIDTQNVKSILQSK